MMQRLHGLTPETLDAEQREIYDSITGGKRAGSTGRLSLIDENGALVGPFNAMLLQPKLGNALQRLGTVVRFEMSLTDRAREIAILTVAQVWDSSFERYAHEKIGRACGLSEDELASLRAGLTEQFTDDHEQLVARTSLALASRQDLTDAEYAAAVEGLGTTAVFELLTLVGYYATLALQMRVFRVTAPGSE